MSHKGFKAKDAVKNAWDESQRCWNFSKLVIFISMLLFLFFFLIILFIWLNPLVPGVPDLYPQYHLIKSIKVFFKVFLKFAVFSEKHLCWNLFSITFRPEGL